MSSKFLFEMNQLKWFKLRDKEIQFNAWAVQRIESFRRLYFQDKSLKGHFNLINNVVFVHFFTSNCLDLGSSKQFNEPICASCKYI